MRITEQSASASLTSRISKQSSRLSVLKEQLVTGKRINRPSDDPSGTAVALNMRTSLNEIAQYKRAAEFANQKLTATDDSLNNYENILDRLKTLVTKGLSDTTAPEARVALATEIEALSSRILSVANTKYGDEYLFGGTRQNAPPFDATTASPAITPTTNQFVQIEPGVNAVAIGATAEEIFSDANGTVFADLALAATALRGTGDPVADRATLVNANGRLKVYSSLAQIAHTINGATMQATEYAQDRMTNDSLSFEARLDTIENVDFAESAIGLSEAQRSLEATLQVAASSRRSLLDFLG